MFGSSGKGQGGAGGKPEKTLGDFAAEYAKSNRSTCKGCLERIDKVRIGLQSWLGFLPLGVTGSLKGKEKYGL